MWWFDTFIYWNMIAMVALANISIRSNNSHFILRWEHWKSSLSASVKCEGTRGRCHRISPHLLGRRSQNNFVILREISPKKLQNLLKRYIKVTWTFTRRFIYGNNTQGVETSFNSLLLLHRHVACGSRTRLQFGGALSPAGAFTYVSRLSPHQPCE